MFCQRALSWVLEKLGYSHINDLRDMKNTFVCTVEESRMETIKEFNFNALTAKGENFFKQRVHNSAVSLTAQAGKEVAVVPHTGNVIGTSEGPIMFSKSFAKPLDD